MKEKKAADVDGIHHLQRGDGNSTKGSHPGPWHRIQRKMPTIGADTGEAGFCVQYTFQPTCGGSGAEVPSTPAREDHRDVTHWSAIPRGRGTAAKEATTASQVCELDI